MSITPVSNCYYSSNIGDIRDSVSQSKYLGDVSLGLFVHRITWVYPAPPKGRGTIEPKFLKRPIPTQKPLIY